MYRIATVFELASVCPPPQGLSGAPKKRKNVQFLLAYVDCFFDCNSKLRQAVAVVH